MSNRVSYALVVGLLLIAAVLRMTQLGTLPPGLTTDEINDIRIAETVRQGRVEVFYNLNGQGREGLYQSLVTASTGAGGGLIGYRMASVWIGLITLALIYALGKRLFGMLAGVAATALMSVSLFPVLLSRAIAPETILPLFVTAVLLALARSLPIYGTQAAVETKTTPFAVLGLLLGLGFYIHPISLAVALFAMVLIAYLVLTQRPFTRRTLSYTWFAVVVMIVIATPYLISTIQRPELAAAGRLLVDDPNKTFTQSLIGGLSGLFFVGDSNPALNLPGRPLIDLVSGLLLVVGVVSALRCWRQSRCMLLLIALVFIAPFVLLAPNSPNFLAFAPLLPLIALLFGLGVTTLYHSLPPSSRRIAALALVALMAFNVGWTGRDLFTNWAHLPQMEQVYHDRLGKLAHYLDLSAGEIPTLVCTPDLRPQNNPVSLSDTQLLALMMHRQNAILRYADCGSALILTLGGEREQIILPQPYDLQGFNPYLLGWVSQGEVLDQPGLPPNSVVMLQVQQALAARIGSFTTTEPVMFAPEAPGGRQGVPPPIRFGGNITFLGYEQNWAVSYAPGDVFPVITYWRVDGVVPTDLRLFTHILADPTSIAAQDDAISVLPEQLRPRDIFIQVTYVQLPRTMQNNKYAVSVGAYEDNTDIRLTVFDRDQPRGSRLLIGQIAIQDK